MNYLANSFLKTNAEILEIVAPTLTEAPNERFEGTADKGIYQPIDNTIGLKPDVAALPNDKVDKELLFEIARLARIAWQYQTDYCKKHSDLECQIDSMAYAVLAADEFEEFVVWYNRIDELANRIAPKDIQPREFRDLILDIQFRCHELLELDYLELRNSINPYLCEYEEFEELRRQ